MTKIDFTQLLDLQVGSAKEPKPLPEGTYVGVIAAPPELITRKTMEGEKPVLQVTVALQEALDVDEDELSEAGGLLKSDGTPRTVRNDFWITEDARFIFEQFCASLGLTGSYREAIQQVPGRQVVVVLYHRTYESVGVTRTLVEVRRIYAHQQP